MNTYKKITDLIGKTPLLEIQNYKKELKLNATILCKLEFFNPSGSVKDRIAKAMILDAEKNGLLTEDSVIIEATSGNTGIGLSMSAAAFGYKIIIVMPDTMSAERRKLARAFGAKIILTDGALGMQGAIDRAKEIARTTPNSYIPDQFANLSNPAIHKITTGPEIWTDTDQNVDFFVAGVGTGGTLTGAGSYLKEQHPAIKIIAVEPEGSPFLSKGYKGPHAIQGIGPGFIPDVLDVSLYDEIVAVSDKDAFAACRLFGILDGVLIGISSGAALHAATVIAKRPENVGKRIVVILPDTGSRYLSTTVYEPI